MFTKLGRDERSHGPAHALRCCGQIRRGGGGGKIGHGGPLLRETSSSDQKATETNQMDSNDLEACEKKCCYFWLHSEVKFLTRFDVFLNLVIFAYFNATLINFYALKSFICIYFV